MLLSDLGVGECAKIVRIDCKQTIAGRLRRMGLTENANISVIRKALFGDPIELKLRDFCLAIRKSVAKTITVEKL
jgi:ferrous iron transport protein A